MNSFLTPATVADRLGLAKPDPVLAWIRTGELKAFNVGTKAGGRPTWRIAEADFNAFLESRRSRPAVPRVRTQRRPRRDRVTQYF